MKCISMRCSTGVPLCMKKRNPVVFPNISNCNFQGVVHLKYKFLVENANCNWISKSLQLMWFDQNTNCDKSKIECFIPGSAGCMKIGFLSFTKFFHVALATAFFNEKFSSQKKKTFVEAVLDFEMFNVCLCAFATHQICTSKLLYRTKTTSVN